MVNAKDKAIIRELALKVAEIAALPVQEEKRRLWRKLNSLKPERPMVAIDQVCWSEMNVGDELTLRCEVEECRGYEQYLRRTLYEWKHFPVDRPVEAFITVPMAIHNTGFDIDAQIHERIKMYDAHEITSRSYVNQFQTMEDVERIKMPVITHDTAETDRRVNAAKDLFDGILGVEPLGLLPFYPMWDRISEWMSVEGALYALVDQPDMMHAMCKRIIEHYSLLIGQLEDQGLLCGPQTEIHCSGAYTDDLPAPGYNPAQPRARDLWGCGMAQMFSTVSPAMFGEYEIDYMIPVFTRFGLVYYGCCEPLDGKMKQVRRIPNLRKISMSPWANHRRGAEEIGRGYVFSNKPNPAHVAMASFDEDIIRGELIGISKICRDTGTPFEFIFKDISTVRDQPERLWKWSRIAMEVAESC